MAVVESSKGKAVTDARVEVVERKGVGHPDTICDSIMEAISIALCREYQEQFGTILHHNIDKGLLSAGQVEHGFGYGRVIKPMELTIGDRATFQVGKQKVPVGEIARGAAEDWLATNLPHIEPGRHLKFRLALAPGSEALTDIFARSGGVRAANDTSAAVGYYPLTPTEQAVLDLEHYLNSSAFKQRYPETGQDVKVMGMRDAGSLQLTVAMPLMAAHVHSEADYFERKERVQKAMVRFARRFDAFDDIDIRFNALDEPGRGTGGVYLSLLGTSAEDADSGQVGRGNRVNGVIAMNRPLGTEAVAGKNPVSHVGKIYNVLAHKLAGSIYESIEGIRQVYVLLLSQIGSPVDRPRMAAAQVLLEPGRKLREVRPLIEELFEQELGRMEVFCQELARGRYSVC